MMIHNTDTYQLAVEVRPYKLGQQVIIHRMIAGYGPTQLELFLTDEEYERLFETLAEHSATNSRNNR